MCVNQVATSSVAMMTIIAINGTPGSRVSLHSNWSVMKIEYRVSK